jgi:hypothetical protein
MLRRVDIGRPDGPRTGTDPPWAVLEIAAQRPLLRHFAGSRLARSAPADAAVARVGTGVASNLHNGRGEFRNPRG